MAGKTKRKARSDGDETREAIFSAAMEEFCAKGFAAASVRTICEKAGANAALANRYFGSKEELYAKVAKKLFGELGSPLAKLPDKVRDDATWREAVEEWIDDMLYMTLPTKRLQRLCAGIFRHEVAAPTRFHSKFKQDFGFPVYNALKKILMVKIKDEDELAMWTASIWSQVSVFALADRKWRDVFRPRGTGTREWAAKIRGHICSRLFACYK